MSQEKRTLTKKQIERILSAAVFRKVPLAEIKPAPYNPRADLQPGEFEYERIKASLYNYRLLQPIVYNLHTHHAVGGNQRLKVLLNEGITEATCAVIDVDIQTEMRINLALNKIKNMWDQPKLREMMLGLQKAGRDLTRTGFSDYDITKLTQDFGANVDSFFEDEEPGEAREKPVRTYKCPFCGEVFQK